MAQVLVIGQGGREHAIAKQFLQSPQVSAVYCAPGNPGMLKDGIQLVPIDEMAFPELCLFVQSHEISLTFVGPENPLAAGIVDYFQAAGLRIFGPSQQTAKMESSKEFAKEFMARHNIPTASATIFSDFASAWKDLQSRTLPVVVKADGLAGGKGVTIVSEYLQGKQVLTKLFQQPQQQVLLEDYLTGEEYSLMVLVGGDAYVPLPLAQDHKRLLDHDLGPNTGGMGAYSPVPQISSSVVETTLQQIVEPTLAGFKNEGLSFAGVMYVGLMLTAEGPKVIEYNMRLGDPETQVLLPQLRSDFYQLIVDLIAYRQPKVDWQTTDSYFGVVLAAPGYPNNPTDHLPVPKLVNEGVFYAGVTAENQQYFSHGGRIMMLTAHAPKLETARNQVYEQLAALSTDLIYRHDIGQRGLSYLQRAVSEG